MKKLFALMMMLVAMAMSSFAKDLTKEQVCKVLKMAADERSNGVSVCVATMNKNKKFQKQQFNSQGYTEFKEFFKDSFDK